MSFSEYRGSEQFEKDQEANALDLKENYREINLDDYPLVSDDQPNVPGIFDSEASLYMNGDGEIIWTQQSTSEDGINERNITGLPYYNFDNPIQKDAKSFTNLGREFFSKDIPNDEKVEHLKKVEEQLIEALSKEYERRSRTNSNQVKPKILEVNEKPPSNGEDPPPQQGIVLPEFGHVDHILQTLSLRNLKYPIDADYGNTQDYIQINQFTYKAPQAKLFFGTDTEKTAGKYDPSQITEGGVPTGRPTEKALGLVKLPMPNSLADSNNVSWGPDQLNALTAAVSSGVLGQTNAAIKDISDFINNDFERGKPLQNINRLLQTVGGTIGGGITAAKQEGGDILSQLGSPGSNLNTLGRSVLGSAVLNFLQFQVSPESILARGSGMIPNNNLALLFNSPTLREFTFSWKMSPRSREEAIRVNNILRFFKQGMAPKKGTKRGGRARAGSGSFFLGTPNIFDIHFKTAREKGSGYNQLFDRNDSVLRIKTCACTGAAVNYTPEGMWNAYEEGQPVAITFTLRFSELEPIFDTDYDDNYFNYDPQRTDLLPVPIDAVGY